MENFLQQPSPSGLLPHRQTFLGPPMTRDHLFNTTKPSIYTVSESLFNCDNEIRDIAVAM